MKALSLYQPIAAAVALRAKRVETRSWPTKHRGPIAIHAAKKWSIDLSCRTSSSWTWCGILRPYGVRMGGKVELEDVLAFGAIIAIAQLVDCRPTDSFTVGELDRLRGHDFETPNPNLSDAWTERMLGDFAPGRFGFILDDIVALDTPILCRGRQRIFNLDMGTTGAVLDSLPMRNPR